MLSPPSSRSISTAHTAYLTELQVSTVALPSLVVSYKDGVLEVSPEYDTNESIIALAKDCVIYSIRKSGDKVVKEDKGLVYAADYIDAGDTVYMDWIDKNDDGENQVFALYVVESDKD